MPTGLNVMAALAPQDGLQLTATRLGGAGAVVQFAADTPIAFTPGSAALAVSTAGASHVALVRAMDDRVYRVTRGGVITDLDTAFGNNSVGFSLAEAEYWISSLSTYKVNGTPFTVPTDSTGDYISGQGWTQILASGVPAWSDLQTRSLGGVLCTRCVTIAPWSVGMDATTVVNRYLAYDARAGGSLWIVPNSNTQIGPGLYVHPDGSCTVAVSLPVAFVLSSAFLPYGAPPGGAETPGAGGGVAAGPRAKVYPRPHFRRQYPHVDAITDWRAQQTARLLWDRVFDLEERLQASSQTMGDLVDISNAQDTHLDQLQVVSGEALAVAQRTAGQLEAGAGAPSTIPNYGAIVAETLAGFVSPIVPAGQQEAGKAQLTRAAAWAIYQTDPRIRLLEKTYGNQIANLSVDLVVQGTDGSFADTASETDLGDGTFRINATWGPKGPDSNTSDESRWIVPTAALAGMSGPMTPI